MTAQDTTKQQQPLDHNALINKAQPGVPFYTPVHDPPAGTALGLAQDSPLTAVPTLFTPLTMRSLTLTNRFIVSPMCQYSSDNGHATDWHLVHLGQFASRGAALTVVEATAVAANGRISPEDAGLWTHSQIAPLRRITDFVHSQGQHVGIQLAHAGRKASTVAPWLAPPGHGELAPAQAGGWPDDVWAPSALPFNERYPQPKELSTEAVEKLVGEFVEAAKRAVEAGFDVIELHAAHGYLISEFLSPLTNKRTDRYGGSFENRTRILVEVIQGVRKVIPETMPLWVRVSGTEWMEWAGEPSWDVPSTIRLATMLPELGVDLLDVSSGGNNAAQKIQIHPYYQVNIAGQVRDALHKAGKKLLVGSVGMITNAEMARDIVQEGGPLANSTADASPAEGPKADVVIMARQFLREPEFVLRSAAKLGVQVQWPVQYHRAEWNEHVRP